MKKILLATFFVAVIAKDSFGVCGYADCYSAVNMQQTLLEEKISAALDQTYNNIDSVDNAYVNHISALEEQNKLIVKLETITIKNNLLLKEITKELSKNSALISTENKLTAKKGEALQSQNEHLAVINKIKSEDPK